MRLGDGSRWSEDLEVEFFIELGSFGVGCGGEKLSREAREDAEVSESVFGKGRDELRGHERGVAGGFEKMEEGFAELVGLGDVEFQADTDARAKGQELFSPQLVDESSIAGEHDGEKLACIESCR